MATNVKKETHKFWEGMAVIAGLFLIFHGGLSFICLNQPFIYQFFSSVESIIGVVTVIVDGWFITHVLNSLRV